MSNPSSGSKGRERFLTAVRAGATVGRFAVDTGIAAGKFAKETVQEHPKAVRRLALVAGLGAGVAEGVHLYREHDVTHTLDVLVDPTLQRNLHDNTWNVRTEGIAAVPVTDMYGETVSHLLHGLLTKDPTYSAQPKAKQKDILAATILLTRHLNPGVNIDDFSSLEGRDLMMPVKLDWIAHQTEVFSKTNGGYKVVQQAAERDGFSMELEDQQAVFEQALPLTVPVPNSPSEPYYLDRDGSEDSQAQLAPDVLFSLRVVASEFMATQTTRGTGWKIALTDLMRDEASQTARHSASHVAGTHATARTVDVSNGQTITPEGEHATYTKFDVNGNPLRPGPLAPFIETELRPAFEKIALDSGWILYKEAGHWHAYIPKETTIDLTEELTTYMATLNGPEVVETKEKTLRIPATSEKIYQKLLENDARNQEHRKSREAFFC